MNKAMAHFGPQSVSQFIQRMTPSDIYQLASDSDPLVSIGEKSSRKREKKTVGNASRLAAVLASAGAFAYMGGGSLAGQAAGALGRMARGNDPQVPPDGGQPPQGPQPMQVDPSAPRLPKPQVPMLDKKGKFEERVDPSPGQGPVPPAPRSLVGEIMEGVDIAALNPMQTDKLKGLARKIELLEKKGKDINDKNVRRLADEMQKVALGTVEQQEKKRFEDTYGKQDSEARISTQNLERLEPQRKEPEEKKLKKGDLVETKQGKKGRIDSVSLRQGIAKVTIDGKVHNKKISDLKKKEWTELESAVIEEHAYSPDSRVALLKFRKGPWYGYKDVGPGIYKKLAKGKGTAKTTGESDGRKWWKGKNPSIGAAFWKHIRDKNLYARLDEEMDIGDFFENFDEISTQLPWQKPVKKNKRKTK